MAGWPGCGSGGGWYCEGSRGRQMTGERLAGYLNALSDERARAALQRCGGRTGEDHAAPTRQTGGLMSGITTHILDIARGRPAAGVAVSLARRAGDGWAELATSRSDTNGRVANLLPGDMKSAAGTYRLRFDTGAYFAALGVAPFHPFVEIVFEIRDAEQYHVPLLVSPFGYTTYRGS